jgi:hypothetical protein
MLNQKRNKISVDVIFSGEKGNLKIFFAKKQSVVE